MISPSSFTGMNDPNSANTYPITSITAYVQPNGPGALPSANPPPCGFGTANVDTTDPDCSTLTPAGTLYWRSCLEIVTTAGVVDLQGNDACAPNCSGDYASVMAVTRCSLQNEPSGSSFGTFGGD